MIERKNSGIAAWEPELPYTEGLYAPVHEEVTATGMEVIGHIPDDLAGMFVQNTANPAFKPNPGHSWFDGDGMVHGIHFEDRRVTYRNRFVRTQGLAEDFAAGHATYVGSLAGRGAGKRHKNVANTDLVHHGGRLLALHWESGLPYELRAPSLETVGTFDYGGQIPRGICSHSKVDAATGELVFFDWGLKPPFLRLGIISRDGKLIRQVPVDMPAPSMQHDMAISEKYALLFDMKAMRMDMSNPDQVSFLFNEKWTNRFGLIERKPADDASNTVLWFEFQPCWLWHTLCAWDEGDEFVLVGVRIAQPVRRSTQDDMSYVDGVYRNGGVLYEWRLNVKTGGVRERALDDMPAEFPRVNDLFLGTRARYGYLGGMVTGVETLKVDRLVKFDLQSGGKREVRLPAGFYANEPSFAPRTNARAEDDGYVLSFVTDESNRVSELWIIDAQSFDKEPVARVKLPQRVAAGFHGRWVSAAEMATHVS